MAIASKEKISTVKELLDRKNIEVQRNIRSIAYKALEAAGAELCGSEETIIVDWNGEEICTVDKFINIFWDKAAENIMDMFETAEYEPNPRIEPDIYKKIKIIAEHYSKRKQWLKALEELDELTTELDGAGNPFGLEDIVNLTGNTWSECADVFIMIMQLTIQHNKEKEFWQQVEYKLNRQLQRMEEENEK